MPWCGRYFASGLFFFFLIFKFCALFRWVLRWLSRIFWLLGFAGMLGSLGWFHALQLLSFLPGLLWHWASVMRKGNLFLFCSSCYRLLMLTEDLVQSICSVIHVAASYNKHLKHEVHATFRVQLHHAGFCSVTRKTYWALPLQEPPLRHWFTVCITGTARFKYYLPI